MAKKKRELTRYDRPERHQKALTAILGLPLAEQKVVLELKYGAPGFVSDEVVVALWRAAVAAKSPELARLTRVFGERLTVHIKALLAKNPAWVRKYGDFSEATKEFRQELSLDILEDERPVCFAEVAFGDYVHKEGIDVARGLFAKKRSAGESLDVLDEVVDNTSVDSGLPATAHSASTEDRLLEFEEMLKEETKLERIYELIQTELSFKQRLAFTCYYLGEMQIDSKKDGKTTIAMLMNCSGRTVRTYIREAEAKLKELMK